MQRANFIDLPTDCPQRDDRTGWTGDAQAYIRSATLNADTAAAAALRAPRPCLVRRLLFKIQRNVQ